MTEAPSKVLRERDDRGGCAPSCILTVLLFCLLLGAGFGGLAALTSLHSGEMLAASYPLIAQMAEEPEDQAVLPEFSNAFHRVCRRLQEDPLSLTNRSLQVLTSMVRDRRLTRAEMEEFSRTVENEQ